MKHLITFLSTIFFTCPSIHSQSNDCNVPYNNYYDFQYLEANAIRTPIYNRGDLFHDKPGERYPLAQFVVPYEEEIEVQSATIFAGGLWLGGYTSDDKLKLAATTYVWVSDNYDYQAGPLDSMGNASQISCKYYGKIWKVKGIIIEQFLADFKDNGRIDNPIPRSIKYWPARSNGNLEYPIDIELAPFFDRNRNNKYEPEKGDYPIIGEGFEKVVPTELIWCVFNANGVHANSQGEPFPIEIQLTTWAFDCEANDLLHHSIFTRYKITNKSEETLERMRIGLWMDADIGCYEDDYFGSDSLLNTTYFYNADNDDEAGAPYRYCGLPNVYGENPPVHSMTFLNQPLNFVTYYIDSQAHPPADMVAPDESQAFYHYLDGKWASGIPLTTGGFGFKTGTSINHAFPSNPKDQDGWSMLYKFDIDPFFNERTISTTSKDSLESNASITLDIAHTFHRKDGYDHFENVDYALERIPNLQEAYNEGFENICLTSTTEEMERGSFEYQVYPNPASQHFQLRLP